MRAVFDTPAPTAQRQQACHCSDTAHASCCLRACGCPPCPWHPPHPRADTAGTWPHHGNGPKTSMLHSVRTYATSPRLPKSCARCQRHAMATPSQPLIGENMYLGNTCTPRPIGPCDVLKSEKGCICKLTHGARHMHLIQSIFTGLARQLRRRRALHVF
jgi:hypothetical protein